MIGKKGADADAEVIALAIGTLLKIGFDGFKIEPVSYTHLNKSHNILPSKTPPSWCIRSNSVYFTIKSD